MAIAVGKKTAVSTIEDTERSIGAVGVVLVVAAAVIGIWFGIFFTMLARS
ncbi:MAG TPA: hypothetical protein VFK80_01740 [Limnochordia bacterium]|nr:hypothetical protein [Limnochordia bacterium]